jgi:hydroxyacyl-ACP dehydratase HTD2-like protein with hotdog domain
MSAISVGDALPELVAQPSEIALFRFSAVTWNPHRIHYDAPYAATEGYPGPLVQGHFHGALLLECVLRFAPGAHLETFSWQNRGSAIAGEVLTVRGTVESVEGDRVTIALEETNAEGGLCATGRASLQLRGDSE